jgi:hypothetical protein
MSALTLLLVVLVLTVAAIRVAMIVMRALLDGAGEVEDPWASGDRD